VLGSVGHGEQFHELPDSTARFLGGADGWRGKRALSFLGHLPVF